LTNSFSSNLVKYHPDAFLKAIAVSCVYNHVFAVKYSLILSSRQVACSDVLHSKSAQYAQRDMTEIARNDVIDFRGVDGRRGEGVGAQNSMPAAAAGFAAVAVK